MNNKIVSRLKIWLLTLFLFRWEEEKKPSGIKWYSLSHKGPIFAPPYIPLPESVHFKYDGKVSKSRLARSLLNSGFKLNFYRKCAYYR